MSRISVIVISFGVSVLCLSFVFPQATAAGSQPAVIILQIGEKDWVIQRENQMMTAFQHGDAATLEKMIDDEFLLTSATSNGELINKRQYIDGGLRQIRVESFKFHDMKVRLIGDMAIINCRIDWKSTWGGKRWDADFLMSDVWVKRGGQWVIVSRHSSYPASYRA